MSRRKDTPPQRRPSDGKPAQRQPGKSKVHSTTIPSNSNDNEHSNIRLQNSHMMHVELNRVASFAECQQDLGDLSCLTLARRGYFYDGWMVVCSQCCMQLPTEENINAENLDKAHRRISLGCPLVNTINVPLPQPRSPGTDLNGTLPQGPISETYQRALARAISRGIYTSGSQTGRGNPDQEQYRVEAARLRSFRGWPQRAPVQPEELAAAGFFYTGTGDRVCCAFCGGMLSGWERGDDPTKEHERHYGDRNCLFPRHHDRKQQGSAPSVYCNDQLKTSVCMSTTPRERAAWSEQTMVIGSESPSLKLNLLTTEQPRNGPKHPEFADQLQRLRTYPLVALQTGQRAESLARAGFFYEGPEDRVRCFYCAGILKNWKPADVPLDEHERWFPQCQFLQLLRNNPNLQDTPRQMQGSAFAAGQNATQSNSASVHHVEPREIKARMDSASVVALLQMGFSKALVRQVIETRLRTTGDDFPSAESLLEAVFELQEKMYLEELPEKPRGPSNVEPAGLLTSLTTSQVIAGADKEELVQPTAFANLLSSQRTLASDAFPSNKPSRGTPAPDTVSSRDVSNSQPATGKNKTRRRQKKCSQKRAPENLKTTESKGEVKNNTAEGSMETSEESREFFICKICFSGRIRRWLLIPCGHMLCFDCKQKMQTCPFCRTPVQEYIKISYDFH